MLCSYHSSDGEGSFEMDGIILFYSVLTKKKKISYSPDFDNFKILFFFLYSERRKRKNFLFSSSLKLGLRRISLRYLFIFDQFPGVAPCLNGGLSTQKTEIGWHPVLGKY